MLAVAASLLIGACGDTGTGGAVNLAPDQNVTIPIARQLGNLDPAEVQDEPEAAVAANLFDGVVRVDSVGGAVVPDLASSLPDASSDGHTYTFHLRKGVHFSNGDKVTAGDFIYSWSRVAALQGPNASIFSAVVGYAATVAGGASAVPLSGLTAPDDLTLKVQLASPQSYFVDRLTAVAAAVVDHKVLGSGGDTLARAANRDWANQPSSEVGTGPYRLTAMVPGTADFSTVPGWWGDPKPVVRRLRLAVVSGTPDPISQFLSDAYDLVGYAGMEHLSVDALARVRQGPSQDLTTVPRGAVTWIGFNYKQGPFAGPGTTASRLRRAFSLAIDRTKLGSALCHDSRTCLPATGGLVPPGVRGYGGEESDPLATFDPAQARRLLKQADPDGTLTRALTIEFADAPEHGAAFQFLQDQWQRNLGLRVEAATPHLADNAGPGASALVIQRWQARYDDPQALLEGYFSSSAGAPGGGFSDGPFDEIVTRAAGGAFDGSLSTYAMALTRLQSDAAYAPLYYDAGNLVVSSHLAGASMGALTDGRWSSLQVLQ